MDATLVALRAQKKVVLKDDLSALKDVMLADSLALSLVALMVEEKACLTDGYSALSLVAQLVVSKACVLAASTAVCWVGQWGGALVVSMVGRLADELAAMSDNEKAGDLAEMKEGKI